MAKKIVLFCLITIALDISLGLAIRYFYFRQKSNPLFRTTYTLNKVKKDIVILGSSRANHHYTDTVFVNNLHKSYYNGGIDGEFFIYSYAMLYGIQKRYTPEIVIIDVNPDALSDLSYNTGSITKLRPYYKDDSFYRKLSGTFDSYESIKSISQLFPYNGKFFSIIKGNLSNEPNDTLGYYPLIGSKDTLQFYKTKSNKEVGNSEKLEKIFEDCLLMANVKKIKLVLVVSPSFHRPVHARLSLDKMKYLAQKNGIAFFDYSGDMDFLGSKQFFYDEDHLNSEGAILFSQKIVKEFK